MEQSDISVCSHCGEKMQKWEPPDNTTWENDFYWVCFNDECSYFVRGWAHMEKTQKVKASYRNQVNPKNGSSGPLPCWSNDAHKDKIIKD